MIQEYTSKSYNKININFNILLLLTDTNFDEWQEFSSSSEYSEIETDVITETQQNNDNTTNELRIKDLMDTTSEDEEPSAKKQKANNNKKHFRTEENETKDSSEQLVSSLETSTGENEAFL